MHVCVCVPLVMGVRAGLLGPSTGLLECSVPERCLRPGGGGVSGGRRGGGLGSGMSGALLPLSPSLEASLTLARSLLPSLRGLISLAKALAPDHWLLLETQQQAAPGWIRATTSHSQATFSVSAGMERYFFGVGS